MDCLYCKANLNNALTTFTVNLENKIVIIKNVPCYRCEQCGEEVFPFEVTERLEQIIDLYREGLTEVAIVNYSAA